MKKVFVASEGFERELTRSRAKGHTKLVIEDGVETFSPISVVTEGTSLVVKPAKDEDGDEIYTVMCKSFGLVGQGSGCSARISVIFCDNGYMLVTLHEGAFIVDLDGKLVAPSIGDASVPAVAKEDIYWVDAEHLLAYSKYMNLKGNFMYDVEFMYVLAGEVTHGMGSFAWSRIEDMDIDLSLGYIAQYEQTQKLKAEAREAKQTYSKIFENHESDYEFDEDEDESDEPEDDGDDDWGDYGM